MVLALSIFMCSVQKEEKKEENNANGIPKKIVIGLDDSFVPMGFKNEKGEIVGFDIDLARAVAQKLGSEVEFKPINWDSKILDLNGGNIDLIWNGLTITDERKKETEKTYTKIYHTKDDETIEVLELIVDENADTQREIETNELNKKIREIVSTLPQKQREVIEYKFYENLKNKEIAEKMKIKEDTVKEYYKIAKKKLKVKFVENELDIREL